MENIHTTDISELVQLTFVGLIGANKEIEKVLKLFHEKYDKPSHGFLFCEFLVHQPLYENDKDLGKKWEFSPFPHRLAKRSLAMIRPEDACCQNFKLSTDEDIALADILIQMKDTIYTQYIYKYWDTRKKETVEKECNDSLKFELEVPFINPKYGKGTEVSFFAIVQNYVGDMNKDNKTSVVWKKLQDSNLDEDSKKSFHILHGLLWPQIEPIREETITSFLIPIASNQIFYGNLLVFVPHFHKDNDIDKIRQLATELLNVSKKHYVPALAIIHEHFFENLVIRNKQSPTKEDLNTHYKLKLGKKPDNQKPVYKSPICRSQEEEPYCFTCQYFGWEESSDNIVEKYLHKLWQDRRTKRVEIKESFVFKNRLYMDPKILDEFEGFLKPSKAKLKKDDDYLPSVLVVASAGAGKEDIPKLLKLFSDCYNRGMTYKINMAALKPDAILPMIIAGGKITCEESNEELYRKETYKLKGILREIREQIRDEFLKFVKNKDDEEGLFKKVEKCEGDINSCIKKVNEIISCLQSKLMDEVKDFETEISEKKDLENNLDGINKELIKKAQDLVRELEKKKGLEETLSNLEEKLNQQIKESEKKIHHKKKLEEGLIVVEEEISKKIEEPECRLEEKKDLEAKLNEKKNEFSKVANDIACTAQQIENNLTDEIELENDLRKVVVNLINHVRVLEAELTNKKELELDHGKIKELTGKVNKIKELENRLTKRKDSKAKLNKEKRVVESLNKKLKKGFDLKTLTPEEKLIVKKLFGRFPTIVLDELNSMSIDSQGTLLRILENADITPIGGYEDIMIVDGKDDKDYREFLTDFLVVGLMNEDPEEITREEAIRFLKKESYIGGLLGDLLYEYILKIRRLRPDLRARMMRNGKFEMPKLAERRADIPGIFYLLINEAKKDYFINCKIRITIDALEYLMRPELDWPENVRLLQTLTKKVAEIIYDDYEYEKKDIIIVREKHIRKAMEKIGMLKESRICYGK